MEFERTEIINNKTLIDKPLLDKFQDGIEEGITKAENAAKLLFVADLPTINKEFLFDSTSDTTFTAVERCSAEIIADDTESYTKVTTAANAGNKYGLANLNLSEITGAASSVVIEMDTRMPGGRWYISFADLTKRPATSNKSTFDRIGTVFSHGTKDGNYYYVNGENTWKNGFINVWLRTKVVIDTTAKTVVYEIKNRETGEIVSSGTENFTDSETDKITGIELYSWTQTSIDVDNIKITANNEVNKTALYIVGSDDAYDVYAYQGGEPKLLYSQKLVAQLTARIAALEAAVQTNNTVTED